MPRTLMGKTRPKDDPYLVYENDQGWTWKVLKAYSGDYTQQYARWLVAASSPMTYGSFDMGDTYVSDVVHHGTLTFIDPELSAAGYTPVDPSRVAPTPSFF